MAMLDLCSRERHEMDTIVERTGSLRKVTDSITRVVSGGIY